MILSPAHLDELRALLGEGGVLASEAARFTYEADALALEKHLPDVVVLPRTWLSVTPYLRQWGPPALVATLPPIVLTCCEAGSGA